MAVLLGVAVGLLCKAVPPAWQLPCAAAVKLVSIFFGTH